jgi:hypothetical protein
VLPNRKTRIARSIVCGVMVLSAVLPTSVGATSRAPEEVQVSARTPQPGNPTSTDAAQDEDTAALRIYGSTGDPELAVATIEYGAPVPPQITQRSAPQPQQPKSQAIALSSPSGGLVAQDLTTGLSAANLAATLVGTGVAVSNATYREPISRLGLSAEGQGSSASSLASF